MLMTASVSQGMLEFKAHHNGATWAFEAGYLSLDVRVGGVFARYSFYLRVDSQGEGKQDFSDHQRHTCISSFPQPSVSTKYFGLTAKH